MKKLLFILFILATTAIAGLQTSATPPLHPNQTYQKDILWDKDLSFDGMPMAKFIGSLSTGLGRYVNLYVENPTMNEDLSVSASARCYDTGKGGQESNKKVLPGHCELIREFTTPELKDSLGNVITPYNGYYWGLEATVAYDIMFHQTALYWVYQKKSNK